MPKITYITFVGESLEIAAENGSTVMQTAVDHGVPGIDADCGGGCACATCHVYVDKTWFEKLKPMDAMEASMLGLNTLREEHSRLSCQIDVTDALDGLVVRIPEFQG